MPDLIVDNSAGSVLAVFQPVTIKAQGVRRR